MPAAGGYVRECGDDRVVDAAEVDREHSVKGLTVHRSHGRSARGDAGIGDHQVNAAVQIGDGRDDSLHCTAVGDVRGQSGAGACKLRRGSLCSTLVEVDDHWHRATTRQRLSSPESDATRPAGNERHLSSHIEAGHQSIGAGTGGPHRPLRTRPS